MEIVCKDIPWQETLLAPIGDLQLGAMGARPEKLKRHIDFVMKHPNPWWLGMGDYCMPLTTEILTRDGFKTYDKLKEGESVAAFDGTHIVWTPLLSVYLNPSTLMMELRSKSFGVLCTPSHDWWVTQLKHPYEPQKVATSNLKSHHRILVAAECAEDGIIDISPDEAALIGWLVTDGHIRTKPTLCATLSQSKEPYRSRIRERFAPWITGEYANTVTRHTKLQGSTFHLKTKLVQALFNRIGATGDTLKERLPCLVTRLSVSSRLSMLEAMLHAEGWRERGHWRFSQKNGPVMDAFMILATLCGERLGLGKTNKANVRQIPLMGKRPVDVANLKISTLESEQQAWCPQTQYRSWICRQGNQITITGNTDFMSPSNRTRLSNSNLYDDAANIIEEKALELADRFLTLFKGTEGRWLGCVPLDTEILTRNGWRHYDQLTIGEEVLGYDETRNECRWTRLRGIVRYEAESTMQFLSKSFHAVCTPDHRWYGESQTHADGNAYGPKMRSAFTKRADRLTKADRLRIAAPVVGDDLWITDREAAILGWLVTDGTLFSGGTSGHQAFIYQTKPEGIARLRELLGDDATERNDIRLSAKSPDAGRILKRKAGVRFYLRQRILKPLLAKTNYGSKDDLPRIVTLLGASARKAMMQAMLDGDGDGEKMFSQNIGPVLDAFIILAALNGIRTGRLTMINDGKAATVSLMKGRPFADIADMKITQGLVVPVWCPQTDLQSWVMRQRGQVSITGNCLEGHHFYQLEAGYTTDQYIAKKLRAPFLGTSAFVGMQFHRRGTSSCTTYSIACHHGQGGGTTAGAPLNKIQNWMKGLRDVDLVLIGHYTQLPSDMKETIGPVWTRNPNIKARPIRFACTGGWYAGYQQGSRIGGIPRGGYPEKGMMTPVAMGAPVYYIMPRHSNTTDWFEVYERK